MIVFVLLKARVSFSEEISVFQRDVNQCGSFFLYNLVIIWENECDILGLCTLDSVNKVGG